MGRAPTRLVRTMTPTTIYLIIWPADDGHRTDHVVGLCLPRINRNVSLASTGLALAAAQFAPSLLIGLCGVKPIDMGPLRVCY